MIRILSLISAFAAGFALVGAAENVEQGAVEFSESEVRRILQHSPLPEMPADPTNRAAVEPAAAHLGQYLFYDARLSANDSVSCSHCHDARMGWSNGLPFGSGIGATQRSVQSLFNVGYNRWFYWDGSADTLWSQALRPMEAAMEMGSNRMAISHLFAADGELRAAYEHIFGEFPDLSDRTRFPGDARPVPDDANDPLHRAWRAMTEEDRAIVNQIFANVGKCIAAYERAIVSNNSPFDTFAAGLREHDPQRLIAISASAKRGLKLFIGEANCRICHTGPNFTDGEFHSIGIPPRGGGMPSDDGRYGGIRKLLQDDFNAHGAFCDSPESPAAEQLRHLMNSPEYWGQFKTPSLRSVAESGPYMHEGQFATLEDVVNYYSTLDGMVQMGHHQEQILVPLGLSEQQRADLVAFLRSLTGKPLPEALTTQPASPIYPRHGLNEVDSSHP